MKLELPRGLRDIEPKEFEKIEWLREKFMNTLDLFGFKKMEPSPIETLETLEAKSGPSIMNEIYYFKDKSQRDLGLRFDLTVGISRYVSSRRDLELPIKIGSFSGVWRYDEPQHGRYRWFFQWDTEIFGRPSVRADAEVIEFSKAYFDKVGLRQVNIEINDREVVEEYITKILGVKDVKGKSELLRMLDKTTKKTEDQIIDEYLTKGFSKESVEKVLSVGKIVGEPTYVLSELERLGLKRTESLRSIVEELEVRGISNFRINLGIVRGIDYYSGIVYEFYDEPLSKLAVAGGGRYDKLMQSFGRNDISATGVAGGIERLIMALERRNALPTISQKRVFVAYTTERLKFKAQKITAKLRENDCPAETDLYSRDLRKQLAYALKHSQYLVIIAPEEDKREKCILRDLRIGKEETVEYEKLLEKVASLN